MDMDIGIKDHIVVTGGTGFLGSHLLPVLRTRYPSVRVTALSSKHYDLGDAHQVERMFADLVPTVVVHLAGRPGGIEPNRRYPADFFHTNLTLMANLFHAAALRKVRKLIYPMGGCSYPDAAASPIEEARMWDGRPTETSLGYSMAKKMGIIASWAYHTQYGLNSVVLVPGNMYGEYDNYRTGESHVIPGLIRRFYEAKLHHQSSVAIWGTGKPTRDFVYAGDVAATIPWFLEHDGETGPVNISTGTTTSIHTLALTIARLTGYTGDVLWDTTKPDGQLNKVFDVKKMHALGVRCSTPLEEGLRRTIRWFADRYPVPGAVRL